MRIFDGKTTKETVLSEVKDEISKMEEKPTLCGIAIGAGPLGKKYMELKQKATEQVGAKFKSLDLPSNISQEEVISKIKELNEDPEIAGIMVQIPLPNTIDKFEIVNSISSKKDVDGLRFCGGFPSCFRPPVVLAILKAIEESGKNLKDSEVVIVGRGFLVGWPLYQCLEEAVPGLVVVDEKTKNLAEITRKADILITATGQPNLIQLEMLKEGVVLIDAGTAELSGQIVGDVNPESYKKTSFYTPVPGGIGPVTIAMLLKNLLDAAKQVK